MIQAFVQQVQTEVESFKLIQQSSDLKTFFEQIKLNHIVSFDCQLKHDFSSNECKNMKRTYATLVFTISQVDGQVKTRILEVSLDELRQFKEEIIRIEEALS